MKTIDQLRYYYNLALESADNYGYDYKKDEDVKKLRQMLSNTTFSQLQIINANVWLDSFIERKNKFVKEVIREEHKQKARIKKAKERAGSSAPDPEIKEEEEEEITPKRLIEEAEEEADADAISKEQEKEKQQYVVPYEQSSMNKDYINELLTKNPSLRKDLKRLLSKELLQGNIEEKDYNEILQPKQIQYDEFAKAPELRSQALRVAQKEYLKGNIDETEYHRVKAMATQPITEHSSKVPFVDIVNYKPKKHIIN